MQDHDTVRWAAETDLGRRLFNHNVQIKGTELRGWTLMKSARAQSAPDLVEQVTLLRRDGKKDGDADLRIDIVEAADWRRAQQRLLETVLDCMNPDIARASGTLAKAGDVVFAAADGPGAGAAAFGVRGNVLWRVTRLASAEIDVSRWAQKLDALLSAAPAAASLDTQSVTVRPGEAVVVAELPDPGGAQWLKVIVPDGELRREGSRLLYTADKGGAKRVRRGVQAP